MKNKEALKVRDYSPMLETLPSVYEDDAKLVDWVRCWYPGIKLALTPTTLNDGER